MVPRVSSPRKIMFSPFQPLGTSVALSQRGTSCVPFQQTNSKFRARNLSNKLSYNPCSRFCRLAVPTNLRRRQFPSNNDTFNSYQISRPRKTYPERHTTHEISAYSCVVLNNNRIDLPTLRDQTASANANPGAMNPTRKLRRRYIWIMAVARG